MDKKPEKLTFIYNAGSSVFSQVSDAIKKVATPSKYQCNLCMITYGAVSMKDEWKKFLETLPYEKEFIHKDEMGNRFQGLGDLELPAVLVSEDGGAQVLISAKEINEQKNLGELISLLKQKLEKMYPLRI